MIKTTACIKNEVITPKLITDREQKDIVWWVYKYSSALIFLLCTIFCNSCWWNIQTAHMLSVKREIYALVFKPFKELPLHFDEKQSSSFFKITGSLPASEAPGISSSSKTHAAIPDHHKNNWGLCSLTLMLSSPGLSEQYAIFAKPKTCQKMDFSWVFCILLFRDYFKS